MGLSEEAKKKRDELATQYGLNRYPIQNIETRKDFTQDINFSRRMTNTEAYQAGFDAGYQVAMDEMSEKLNKLANLIANNQIIIGNEKVIFIKKEDDENLVKIHAK